jgi:large repetitive protein
VAEGSSGTPVMTFTVTLSAATSRTITVGYGTNSGTGTATAGSDYTTTGGTLTFTPGSSTRTFTVPVAPDLLDEANETFTVTLANPVNATIATATATATINDDDPQPSVSMADISVAEGDAETVNAVLTVNLSAPSGRPTSVAYQTNAGTATSNVDYTATTGTLNFAAGVTSLTITVPVRGDTINELNEAFTVSLSGASFLSLPDPTASVTIVENDPLPTVSINSVSQSEAASGSATMQFTVTLSRLSSRNVTVQYSTANGTAIAGSDYNGVTNSALTIAAGQTQATFNITVRGDFIDEPNETFTVTLNTPTNATLGTATGTGTIIDND